MPKVIEPNGSELDEVIDLEVAGLFPGRIGDAINNLTPSLRNMGEMELIKAMNPTPLDYAIRRAFWDAIEKYKTLGKTKIPAARIYENTCNRGYFEESYLANPLKVAWMCRPIVQHQMYYEAINKIVVQKLLDFAATHEVSEKTLHSIMKLAEMTANRAYGGVVQKIQTKNLNLEMRALPPTPIVPEDASQLEARARALQQKLVEGTIDVTPDKED